MRENRSGTQILFGYLPEQTVDLRGRVWKIDSWVGPIPVNVDTSALREELLRQCRGWETNGRDSGYAGDLRRGYALDVLSLNRRSGVRVSPFPEVWVCKACRRIGSSDERNCRCGRRKWGQFHFVGYHTCGAIYPPSIPRCPAHKDVRVTFPGTASAAEIRFDCPECGTVLRKGLGFRGCDCGNGRISYTVHRAASVYTPRSVVIVNPLTPEKSRQLRESGGPARALEWTLDGLVTPDYRQTGLTRDALVKQLTAQGISESVARSMAEQAIGSGEVTEADDLGGLELDDTRRLEAETQAVTLATALLESRKTIPDLVESAEPDTELHELYAGKYVDALEGAGLEAVELTDKFPVLTGVFAYTRGEFAPGASQLVPFMNGPNRYAVYADLAETEALLFRLRPTRVLQWLRERGFDVPECTDERAARVALLEHAWIPAPGDDPPEAPSIGTSVLVLLHSFSHRLIRQASVLAGIERTSLSELLLPAHLSFFVYAAARGDFVLGGLQALFESELDRLLSEFVDAEHRCALDPGCESSGGACSACLHIGEPSCRWFNRFLDRSVLHGPTGYLGA